MKKILFAAGFLFLIPFAARADCVEIFTEPLDLLDAEFYDRLEKNFAADFSPTKTAAQIKKILRSYRCEMEALCFFVGDRRAGDDDVSGFQTEIVACEPIPFNDFREKFFAEEEKLSNLKNCFLPGPADEKMNIETLCEKQIAFKMEQTKIFIPTFLRRMILKKQTAVFLKTISEFNKKLEKIRDDKIANLKNEADKILRNMKCFTKKCIDS